MGIRIFQAVYAAGRLIAGDLRSIPPQQDFEGQRT